MSYFVYILQSIKDHKFYIGSTSDVAARVKFHNSGLQRSTRNRIQNRKQIKKIIIIIIWFPFKSGSEIKWDTGDKKYFEPKTGKVINHLV